MAVPLPNVSYALLRPLQPLLILASASQYPLFPLHILFEEAGRGGSEVCSECGDARVAPFFCLLISPTPEHCTSKTCFRCLSPCGPWTDKEDKMGKKIRGLRLCTQRDCMLPLNRDKNASINIGNNFTRLLNGMTPIARLTNEELSFHKSRLCLECSD